MSASLVTSRTRSFLGGFTAGRNSADLPRHSCLRDRNANHSRVSARLSKRQLLLGTNPVRCATACACCRCRRSSSSPPRTRAGRRRRRRQALPCTPATLTTTPVLTQVACVITCRHVFWRRIGHCRPAAAPQGVGDKRSGNSSEIHGCHVGCSPVTTTSQSARMRAS